ncbi:MAG: VCBS domain-containing protein [Xanthobacteraceae bacterium]
MFNGTGAEPGEQGLKPNAAEPPWGQPRRAIGCIHTIVGSFTVARAGAALQLKVGDPVFEGDKVETGADSTVAIQFSDGTVFKLSACARMVLSEFARDGARSGPARFVLLKGAIAFMAGKTARGGFSIDTPIARIQGSRGGGIVSLAVAALTFAALETVRADDQPVIDDERVELPHGTFELVTKEQVPQVIVVDDPRKSVVLQKLGSTVDINRVTNSPERMDDLGQISRETFRIFQQGQRDLFIQHEQRAGLGGSSEPISDFPNYEFSTAAFVSPVNLITSDPSLAPRVETIPVAVAAAYIPEAPPAVVQTTIVDNFPIIPISSSAPAITLATVGQQTFIDTSALDLFSPVNGAVSATAPNNAPLTYEIVGGTADSSQNGYDQSLTGAYGALYLNSTTGAYTFVPDNTAINALTAPAAANFTLTASDGNSSAEQTVTFMLDGADDAPTLQPVTGATYPNDVEINGFNALAVASNPLAPVTGTLIGADVDLPAQTLTYGIVDGTSGGVLGEVAYDVSKTGAYGTLYVNSATGDYEFVPNEAAIKALPATAETVIENFTVTVSDGSLSAEQAFTVTVNGANDAPVITGVTTGSVTEDDTGHSLASGQLNATDPDLDATQTWTVVGGTPSIAADYQFRADSFSVTRANGAINGFPDDFNSPPSSPTYSFIAGGFDVADGKLLMDSDNAAPFIGVGANSTPIIGQTAVVRTNVDDTDPTLGLKKSTQFTITGVFDLVSPDSPREAYGIRATDRLLNDVVFPEGTTLARAGDDTFELVVRGNLFGQDLIALRQVNFATNTVTNFQSFLLAPPEEADQISLTFDHAENSPYLVASFQYLSDGVPIGPPIFFSQPAPIFGTAPESTTTENWTLAQIISYAPAQSDSFLSGMYGSLNINQAGAWTYLLDNTRLATQSLAEGQHATDSFTVQVTDQYGASDIKVINIDVVGTNDAPVITSGPAAVAVSEEGLANGVPDNSPAGLDTVDSATAGGTITATDVDSDPLHMTLGIPTEPLTSGGTWSAWTLDETDEPVTRWSAKSARRQSSP